MIFYRTDRLVIRNVAEKDVPTIYDYRNNEICVRYQRGQAKELKEIENLVAERKNDVIAVNHNLMLAVALKDSDEMVGEIVVMPNDGCISLGYTFSYKHHRKRYAFEALSLLIAELHTAYPDWEFISFTKPENKASIALLEKLGYTHLGCAEKLTSEVYGKWAKKRQRRYEENQMVTITQKMIGSILDAGGGGEEITGRTYGSQVTAIDNCQEELDEAPGGYEKILMDACNLTFQNQIFDHVTFFYSLMFMNADTQRNQRI